MRLLWEDTFDRPVGSAPDPGSWSARTGNWKPGVQQYADAGARIVAGYPGSSTNHLAVTARRTADGFESARIDTRGKREFRPPVLISASMSMPAGAEGVVPAFWTLGANPADPENWPEEGEIDIVEWQSNHPVNVGPRLGRACAQTIHGPSLGNPKRQAAKGRTTLLELDQSVGFHTYALYWFPDHIFMTVDGVHTLDVDSGAFADAGGDWTPFSGAWPHYLLLNVAVDTGMTPRATDASPFPASLLVDWVRVYAL